VYDEEGIDGRPISPEGTLQLALAGMGLLQTMPLAVTLTVEKGIFAALKEIGYMFLSGGPMYFIFQIQTKSHYFQQTLLAGGAMYRPTGRGFVTRHSPFDENFRFFATSHIYLGFELMVALVLYKSYTKSHQYLGLTWSLWLTTFAFLFGPFWFNPLSFELSKVVEDYNIWMTWMTETCGTSEQSWNAWFNEENGHMKNISLSWKIFLMMQRCLMWIIIAAGIAGPTFLDSPEEQGKFLCVFAVFILFSVGNYFIHKLERTCSYAFRRFASLVLTTLVLVALVVLFAIHMRYFTYMMATYYFAGSVCFFCLVNGIQQVKFFYKLHDYVVGHFIFLILFLLAIIQIPGILQTWLLYHNALSSGVVIEDILKYARKSKEKAGEESEVSIAELKAQLAEQDRTIKMLMSNMGGIEMNERSSLLLSAGQKGYGATTTAFSDDGVMSLAASSVLSKPSVILICTCPY
jgi:callose synthase